MADFTTNMTSIVEVNDSIVEEFDAQFLIAQAQEMVMDQFVTYKREINSKKISFPKYAQLALATTPLTDKEDATSEAMSDSLIDLEPAEYGNVITKTELASLQTGGRVDLAAAQLVGINAGRTQDKLCILAGEAGTQELFPGAVASEAALTGSDVCDASFLNKVYNKLARSSAIPFDGGMYVAVLHDDQIHDLRDAVGSGSWQDINKYARPEEVLRNEVGMIAGFRIVRDNHVTINTDAGSGTVDSYHGQFFGRNAFGKAESRPAGVRMTGPFDKLGRFLNVGWFGVLKYGLIDTDAHYLGTTASSVGANA